MKMILKIPFAGMLRKLLRASVLKISNTFIWQIIVYIANFLSPVNNSHHCCMLLGVAVQILKFEAFLLFLFIEELHNNVDPASWSSDFFDDPKLLQLLQFLWHFLSPSEWSSV